MRPAMFCANGDFIAYIDPDTGLRDIVQQDFYAPLNQDIDIRTGEPQPLPKFCGDCGAPTMSKCSDCGTFILRHDDRAKHVPKYCSECGTPFPWTISALDAAETLTDQLDLPDAEKLALKDTFVNLTRDTPRTQEAAYRFKTTFAKISNSPAGKALWGSLQQIVTQAALHLLKL